MKTASPPSNRLAEHGFTMIELLVVLTIVALLSGAVLMTFADPRGGLSGDADRFAGRVRAARDRAVVLARPVAVWVSPTGYGFDERRGGRWHRLAEKPLAPSNWAKGTRAEVAQQGGTRLWFDTIGHADQPMTVILHRNDRALVLVIGLDGRVARRE